MRARLKDQPWEASTATVLAQIYSQFGRKRDAVNVLARTGSACLKKGRPLEAIALYKKVSQVDPRGEITTTFMVATDLKRLVDAAQGGVATAPAPGDASGVVTGPPPGSTPAPVAIPEEIRRKKEALRSHVPGIPLLKDIPVFQFELVLDKLHLRSLNTGESLFREGDAGSTLLFVASGELAAITKGDDGKERVLDVLGPGDIGGEISFLSGLPRSATLTATRPTEILELERKAVDQIAKKARGMSEAISVLFKERVLDQVLARSRVFGALPREERDAVAKQLEPIAVEPGGRVISEGDRDDVLYLVRSGEVRVFTARGGREVELARLRPHEVFGEFGALRGIARTASVEATVPTELLRLGRAALAELVERQPTVKASLDEIQLERFVSRSQMLTS